VETTAEYHQKQSALHHAHGLLWRGHGEGWQGGDHGGRNVTIVGIGKNIIQANKQAYEYIHNVRFEGAWYRSDIGNKFFEN
jgi:phosphoribosylamine-glycine ligase